MATNPCCSKSRQTSSPDRTRSLPNRYLDLRHEHFAVEAPGDLGLIGHFEEECQRLNQIRPRFFDGQSLTCDIESGQRATKPLSSRSMIAVNRRDCFMPPV